MSNTFFVTAMALLAAIASGQEARPDFVIGPAPTGTATLVLEDQPVQPSTAYALEWMMRVDGDKSWRFRAPFAGVRVTVRDADGAVLGTFERHTHCYRTLGWQRAWYLFETPPGAASASAAFAIESDEALPGRFELREVRLVPATPAPGPNQALVHLDVRNDMGHPTPARLYVRDAAGRFHVPPYAYGFDGGAYGFVLADARLDGLALPPGTYDITAMKGFRRAPVRQTVELEAGASRRVSLAFAPPDPLLAQGWYSGDHHVHLFRHGSSVHPMIDLRDVYTIAQAEGLDYLPFMGEDRITPETAQVAAGGFIGYATAELTRDVWGHICPIAVFEWPPDRAAWGSLWPLNHDIIAAAEAAGGAIAYAHPYARMMPGRHLEHVQALFEGHGARGLPIDLALGGTFTIDILTKEGGNDGIAMKLHDYFRLLGLGYRPGVSASTDFHVDQARQPIGAVRTYARAGRLAWPDIAAAYRKGHTVATNGPLLALELDGHGPGDAIALDGPEPVTCRVQASSHWGLDRVTLWHDGQAVAELGPGADGQIDAQVELDVARSGWVLAVAEGPAAAELVHAPEGAPMTDGQFAITSPISLDMAGHSQPPQPEAAQYFIDWIDAVSKGLDAVALDQSPETIARLRTQLDTARADLRSRGGLD